MPDRPLPESPPPDSPPIVSPDGATPPSAWDETLMRAIDAGQLDASQAADAKLAGAFAAHRKLESLFAALRGQPDADPNTQSEPAPTQLGRYIIGARAAFPDAAILGAGAFGTVYLAHDPELNRDVAIKVSSLSLGKTARARADAIAAEARHAASLNHPGIVTIHDVGRDGERLFIVMQYIRGQTLEQRLREGPVAPARAAELLAAVADALHYAHKRGFVHRDLKPANILLDEQGGPHVADFGLAVSEETQRALGGQVAGTPEYMAPEQIPGESHRLDGRTDVWALGVILYESLAGRRPFAGQTTRVVLDEIEHRDPKPPRQINDAVPAELERICIKCLAKSPPDRYRTAGDVAADLRRWRRSQTAGARTGRRAMMAGALALSVLFTAFAWRPTSKPPIASVQPLSGTIDVRLWNPDDRARRGLTLAEPGALPLRVGDQVRIEATVNPASYLYVVWIGADGRAYPVYPWHNGNWDDRAEEKPVARLSLPDDPTLGWPMSGPPGTETLLLLARESPLGREIDLRELLQGLPDILIDDPQRLVRLDEGKVEGSLKRAPEFSGVQSINDPALAAQRFLKEHLSEPFPLVKGLSFSVAGG